ncbi:filamentous hemagglutinin N-terminal domain-containing protein, partial [Undibacterium sp. CCC1.1]
MNKNAYRIVFNKKRQLLMVVAEQVSSAGTGVRSAAPSSARQTSQRLWRFTPLTILLASLFGTLAQAQIVTAPGTSGTSIALTANGRPLVQIAAPNASGLSHNRYEKFNVDGNGAILNNANSAVLTQQGGYIAANPHLGKEGARIILNEVRGSGASQLHGFVEVAGQRAQVIIANPNGISCSGCGFINTDRAMLSTGAPVFDSAGALNAWRVTRGAIEVSNLQAANIDSLDLIARTVRVNGAIWAKQLRVISGANQIDHAALGVQAIAAANDTAADAVGIDVASLGGMYANKIRLVGTAAGVGVVSLGNLAAHSGELEINSRGHITLAGQTTARDGLVINSDSSITQRGQIYSQQQVSLHSKELLSNSGDIRAGQDLTLQAQALQSSGSLAAGVDDTGVIERKADLRIHTDTVLQTSGWQLAGGAIDMRAASMQLDGANTEAGGAISLQAREGELTHRQATLQAGQALHIEAAGTLHNDGGTLHGASISISAGGMNNQNGGITSAGSIALASNTSIDNSAGNILSHSDSLQLHSAQLSNQSGRIALTGAGLLSINSNVLDNGSGQIASNGDLSLQAQTLTNQGQLSAISHLQAVVTQRLNNDQGTLSAAQLSLQTPHLSNQSGQLIHSSSKAAQFAVTEQFDNRNGHLYSESEQLSLAPALLQNDGGSINHAGTGRLSIDSATISNRAGQINGKALLTISSAGTLDNSAGLIQAAHALQVRATTLDNSQGRLLSLNQDGMYLAASGYLHNLDQGVIAANGDVTLEVQQLRNQGRISAVQHLQARIATLLDNEDGQLQASRLSLSAQDLRNQAGKISQSGSDEAQIAISGVLDNRAGLIESNSTTLHLGPARLLNQQGQIHHVGSGLLDITSGVIANQGGSLLSNASIALATEQEIDNTQGSVQAAQGLHIQAGQFNNEGGRVLALGPQGLSIRSNGAINNLAASRADGKTGGLLSSHGDMQLQANSLRNNGDIIATVALNAKFEQALDNRAGQLRSQGQMQLDAATLNNQAARIDAPELHIVAQQIDNRHGQIAADALHLDSDSVDNRAGRLQHFGHGSNILNIRSLLDNSEAGSIHSNSEQLLLAPWRINNDSGSILLAGQGQLQLQVGAELSNRQGTLGSNGELQLSAGQLDNQGGSIAAAKHSALSVSQLFDNRAGQVLAAKDLQLSAANIDNRGGTLEADRLDLDSHQFNNQGGKLQQFSQADSRLRIRDWLDNSQGEIRLNGSQILLQAGVFENHEGSLQHAGSGTLQLQLGEGHNRAGTILANNHIDLQAARFDNQAGKLFSHGDASLVVSGSIDNRAGSVQAAHALTLRANDIDNQGGRLLALGNSALKISAKAGLINRDDWRADGESGGLIGGNGAVDIQAGTLTNHSKISAANNLQLSIAALLDNQGGRLLAGQTLQLSTPTLLNRDGEIDAKLLLLQADEIDNQAGKISADGLHIDALRLFNQAGLISQFGASPSRLNLSEILINSDAGQIVSNAAQLDIITAALANERGSIRHAGNDSLRIEAGQVRNQAGTISSNARLQVQADWLDNRQGQLHTVQTAALRLNGAIDNQQGSIQAGQGMQVQATTLDNSDGHLLSLNADGLQIHTTAHLENAGGQIGSNGAMQLQAASLSNSGSITAAQALQAHIDGSFNNQHGRLAAAETLNLQASTLDNRSGQLDARDLHLNITALDNRDGQLSADQLQLRSEQVDNRNGSIRQLGLAASELLLSGRFDNRHGLLQSNADSLLLHAAAIDNENGQLLHAGNTRFALQTGLLNNQQGKIASNGRLQLQAQQFHNQQAQIEAGAALAIDVDSVIDNSDGSIRAAGALQLQADTLINDRASLLSLNGDGLQIALRASLFNRSTGAQQARIGSNGSLSINAATLHNRGLISAADTLHAQVREQLDNQDGAMAAGQQLHLDAVKINNRNGRLDAEHIVLRGTEIDNRQGNISAEQISLDSHTLNNQAGQIKQFGRAETRLAVSTMLDNSLGGQIHSNSENLRLALQHWNNDGGSVELAGSGLLDIEVAASLSNQNGTIGSNGQLQISADHLNNQAGQIFSQQHTALSGRLIDNRQQGKLSGAQFTLRSEQLDNREGKIEALQRDLRLDTNALDNRGGSIQHLGSGSLAMTVAQQLDNSSIQNIAGFIGSNGQLQLHAGRIDNRHGTIYSQHDAQVHSADVVNNHTGIIQSDGALTLSAVGALDNQQGRIENNGSAAVLAISALSLDNRAGRIANSGSGSSRIISHSAVHNAGGTIGSNGEVYLAGIELSNIDGASIIAGGALTLALRDLLDNRNGSIFATDTITSEDASARLDNRAGQLTAGQAIRLQFTAVDNRAGHIRHRQADAGDATAETVRSITLSSGSLQNEGGHIDSLDDLTLTLASLDGSGSLAAGRDAAITLQGDYHNASGKQFSANRDLYFSTSGKLSNDGSLSAMRHLHLNAGALDNRGLINAGGGNSGITVSGTLNNWGRVYGDDIAIGATALSNTQDRSGNAGVIAARRKLQIGATSISNTEGALLYSAGQLRVGASLDTAQQDSGSAAYLLNASAKIEADGDIELNALTIDNRNDHFATEQRVTSTKEIKEYQLQNDSQRWDSTLVRQARCNPDNFDCLFMPDGSSGQNYTEYNYTRTISETFITQSRPAELISGGNLLINGIVNNNNSRIVVGGTLHGAPTSITNNESPGTTFIDDQGTSQYTYTRWHGGFTRERKRHWNPHQTYAPAIQQQTSALQIAPNLWQTFNSAIAVTPLDVSSAAVLALGTNQAAPTLSGTAAGVATLSAGNTAPTTLNDNITVLAAAQGQAGNDTSLTATASTQVAVSGSAGNAASINAGSDAGTPVSGADSHTPQQIAQISEGSGNSNSNNMAADSIKPISAPAASVAAASIVSATGPQTLAQAGLALPHLVLPNKQLFQVRPQSSLPYLIETDPAYTNYQSFLSSDYLLSQIGSDPQRIQKRLGDGFYEQKLINEQILELTGRRFLGAYGSNEEQYRALMTAGVATAEQFQLTPGIALSGAQMAALTADMVWLVAQSLTLPDGSSDQVLVPVVYLAQAHTSDIKPNGALISAQHIDLRLPGSLHNSGTLLAAGNMHIQASNIHNTGQINNTASSGNTVLTASNDIINHGGTISGHRVGILAGRDVLISTSTTSASNSFGTASNGYASSHTLIDRVAGVHAAQLSISAGRDLTLTGADIQSSGSASLLAGRDVNLQAVTTSLASNSQTDSGNSLRQSNTTVHGTQLHSGGDLLIRAERDLSASAAYLHSDGNLIATATRDLTIASAAQNNSFNQATTQSSSGLFSSSMNHSQATQQQSQAVSSTISGERVQLQAGNNLAIVGSHAVASGDLALAAGHDLRIQSAQNSSSTSLHS